MGGWLRNFFALHAQTLASYTHQANQSTRPNAFQTACFSASRTHELTFSQPVVVFWHDLNATMTVRKFSIILERSVSYDGRAHQDVSITSVVGNKSYGV